MPAQIVIETETTFIEIEDEVSLVQVEETGVRIIEVTEQGLAGPPGLDGVAADFEQTFSAALTWTVNHNLGKYPLITLLSAGNAEMVAEVIHTSVNQFIAYWKQPTAGRVRCV